MPPRVPVFENVEMDLADAYWQAYRVPRDSSAPEVPSYAIQTAKESAKLNQIILQTINTYCGSRGGVTAQSILRLYQRYLRWKESLPSALQTGSTDSDALPHVLYLQ